MSVTVGGVDEVLTRARAGVRRLDPYEAWAAVTDGALLVDTRTDRQRARRAERPARSSSTVRCSLAAASLREVGLHRATDLAGGVEA
ncbi:hypothetical protein [Actinoplanes sp. NPDC049316]|uniref:hypothetical protein n=1 Tax=Actinoplanes sp. NPDC049316 TaxID=3154727 RepID=UPI0034333FB0